MLRRQQQDQAAAIPQRQQIRQEQEQPQVRALAVHIGEHPAQRIRQLLPLQPRQHPRVGAQGIAEEAGGPGRLQPLAVAGLRFLHSPGQIHRPAAGAVGEFQQAPAVVDQLQTVPQAGEGGVLQPGGLVRRMGLRLWGEERCWWWLTCGGGWSARAAGCGHSHCQRPVDLLESTGRTNLKRGVWLRSCAYGCTPLTREP